jgi:GntR family phosphonate transport system transcriptional regulator
LTRILTRTTRQWRIVYETLADELARNVYRPGERLPSEQETAARFGVSRNTVRRALLSLSQEGRIRILNGSGSFAAYKDIVYEIEATSRFSDTLARYGAEPRQTFLSWRILQADEATAEQLELPTGAAVVEIVSLISSRDLPLVFSRRCYPDGLVPDLVERYRAERSITRVFAGAGLGRLRRLETTVGARLPTPEEAEALAMPSNSPVLVSQGLGKLATGRMAEINVSVLPAHLVRLKFRNA